jgi:hypothetical protein
MFGLKPTYKIICEKEDFHEICKQEILIQLVYIICGFDEHDLRIIRVTQKMADDKTETIDLINKTIQLILSWSGIQNYE